jgi:nitrogen fixation protein FixH
MYTGNPITENTPPQIQGITFSKTSGILKGGTFTVTVSTYDPDGDPLSYQIKLCSKYINGSVSITNATYTQTSPGVFTVTAPNTSGVWKLYIYANDGKGNIGIDSRSFGVQ